MAQKSGARIEPASSEDVRRILGPLDEAKLLNILELKPTVLDIENVAMGLSGDPDIFGGGKPLESVSGDIIAILTADEGDDPARPR